MLKVFESRLIPPPQPFFSFSIALKASCPFGFVDVGALALALISTSPPAPASVFAVAGVNAGAFLSFAPSLDFVDLGLGGGRKSVGSGAACCFVEEEDAAEAPAGGNRWVAGSRGRVWESKEKGL